MIVVAGAGAAGLMAAICASDAGRAVTVLETTADGGRKILISGGGRCNVLPQSLAPARFVSDSPPALVRRHLTAWPLREQLAFFEERVGVPLALETDSGKWFPASNRARDVRDGLMALARRQHVQFRFRTALQAVTPDGDGLVVRTSAGDLRARAVIVATGGLSVPATGSTGDGLTAARALGHRVHPTYAALTPLVADPAVHAALSGVSLDVRLRARHEETSLETRGGFLFTHRGYSGPAVLDVSHVAVRSLETRTRATIRVRWADLDEAGWHDVLIGGSGSVERVLSARVPRRVADQLITECNLPRDIRCSDLRREDRLRLVERLTAYPLPWTGHEGFKKAEVTGGGVALDEVHPKTLESRRVPGLFFCGEVLDAFGPIGGHNFAWAWATGRTAGLGARARV